MEDAHKLLKIPKSECPDIWIHLPRHKWPKSWSSMEDPVVPLERNIYGHLLAGLIWEKQFEKILLKYGWARFPIGNPYSYPVKEGYSYLCMWMKSNWLEGHKTLIRCGKYSTKKSIWENQHLSLIMYISGVHSKTMWNKQRYCWQLQNHVWITNFCGETWKIAMPWKCSYFFVVLWYGRSCQEMCGTILWIEQDDSTTLQSIYSMHEWPPLFSRKKSVGQLSKVCSQIVLTCLYLPRIGRPDILWSCEQICTINFKNRPKLVTIDWVVWSRTFIIQVTTNNIVMRVILLNNADWDCFKTLTLRDILKIRNPLLEEKCAFLEVIHLFQ